MALAESIYADKPNRMVERCKSVLGVLQCHSYHTINAGSEWKTKSTSNVVLQNRWQRFDPCRSKGLVRFAREKLPRYAVPVFVRVARGVGRVIVTSPRRGRCENRVWIRRLREKRLWTVIRIRCIGCHRGRIAMWNLGRKTGMLWLEGQPRSGSNERTLL